MPHDIATSFGDLLGKLEVVSVSCRKCPRRGQYLLAKLITRYRMTVAAFFSLARSSEAHLFGLKLRPKERYRMPKLEGPRRSLNPASTEKQSG